MTAFAGSYAKMPWLRVKAATADMTTIMAPDGSGSPLIKRTETKTTRGQSSVTRRCRPRADDWVASSSERIGGDIGTKKTDGGVRGSNISDWQALFVTTPHFAAEAPLLFDPSTRRASED